MSNVDEIRVSSWKELNELVYEGSWSAELQRHRSTAAFRGICDAAPISRTGLVRLGGAAERLEGHLLRNFRNYAERQSVPRDSIWNWLAQHHGLPTRLLADEGSHVFTAEMLEHVAGSLPDFDADSRDPFVLFFEPPSLDSRIVNQFALFSLLSSPRASLDEWLARHPGVGRHVVIPAELKWEVRDKLDQANINERVLFPGLECLSRWLKRYYMPR